MYSIIQVCKHGIKVRYVSDNLDSINEKYTVLNNLDNVDKLYIYDNLNNKCVLSENFGNYFESLHNENKKINIIEPYEIENFATIENVTSTKEELLRNSLVQSSNIRYN